MTSLVDSFCTNGFVPVRDVFSDVAPPCLGPFDGSYNVNGQWWVNVNSRSRALLTLFLFSDISELDAPTEVLGGSHLVVPRVLAPHGEQGVFFGDVVDGPPLSTFGREVAGVTGRAGDVFVGHPFMVHRATAPMERTSGPQDERTAFAEVSNQRTVSGVRVRVRLRFSSEASDPCPAT